MLFEALLPVLDFGNGWVHIKFDVKGVLMFRKTSALFLFFGLLSFIEFAGHFQDWQNILKVYCKNKHIHHIGRNDGTLLVRRVPVTYMDCNVCVI